jgi:hypothetical protein
MWPNTKRSSWAVSTLPSYSAWPDAPRHCRGGRAERSGVISSQPASIRRQHRPTPRAALSCAPTSNSPLAIAAGIAAGPRSTASELGLEFLPLAWEHYDIVLPADALGAAQPLLAAIADPKIRTTITELGGYDLQPGRGNTPTRHHQLNITRATSRRQDRPAIGVSTGMVQTRWKIRTRARSVGVVGAVIGPIDRPRLLLLGQPDARGRLRFVARTATLPKPIRRQMGQLLSPPRRVHPWPVTLASPRLGMLPGDERIPITPVEPRVVIEFDHDFAWEQHRYRHAVKLVALRQS